MMKDIPLDCRICFKLKDASMNQYTSMKLPNQNHETLSKRRRGATAVLIVLLLPALLAIAAFAINIAHIESLNTDVQIAADAAVRAASREYIASGDEALALVAAKDAAARNPIAGQSLPLTAKDLEFGRGTRENVNSPYQFDPTGSGNAVRLTTRTLADGEMHSIRPVFSLFGGDHVIRTERSAVSTQAEADVCLVVDRSGSMAYSASEMAVFPPNPAAAPAGWVFGDPVPPQSRWLDLIAAVKTFESELNNSPQNEKLALSVYNDATSTPVPLTNDYSAVIAALDEISFKFDAGGTNIGDGLREGAAALNDPDLTRDFALKVVVLMTDGIHNFGTEPDRAARRLAGENITVFTVTFSDEADQERMKEVAEICSGQHFHAVTREQLSEAFKQIARSLPTLITK